MSERLTEAETSGEPASGWVVGFALFAGVMMVMAGVFGVIAGIAGIAENKFYVVRAGYVFEFDVTAWGWIHLLIGVLVGVAGVFVFSGQPWARGIGIATAVVHAVVNFIFIPYYPFWSILLVALDITVIWALAMYSRRTAEADW